MDHITDSDLYELRYFEESDLPFLKKWLHDERIMRYFPFTTTTEADEYAALFKLFGRYKAVLTAEVGNLPVAASALFLMPYVKIAHHASLQFAVDPLWEGKGIGTSIIKNTIHLAKSYFRLESVHIELFEDSPAIAILKSLGFEVLAVQKKFVKRDGIYLDKILLQIDFTKRG